MHDFLVSGGPAQTREAQINTGARNPSANPSPEVVSTKTKGKESSATVTYPPRIVNKNQAFLPEI
jgi:hypothetical protein